MNEYQGNSWKLMEGNGFRTYGGQNKSFLHFIAQNFASRQFVSKRFFKQINKLHCLTTNFKVLVLKGIIHISHDAHRLAYQFFSILASLLECQITCLLRIYLIAKCLQRASACSAWSTNE